MKIIYEQGDIVYNKNNFHYGIVLTEYEDVPKIIELGKETFINNVPKAALRYEGHIDVTKLLKRGVDEVIQGCYEESLKKWLNPESEKEKELKD